MRLLSTLLLLATCALSAVHAQTCLDENGNAVDWFIVVKIARLYDSSYSSVSSGVAYLYGDSNSYANPAAFWSNSSHLITDATSSVGATVSQIYNSASNPDFGYLMYNDETPAGVTSYSYGHSKGHMAWSSKGGFWLIHSVPKFADSPQNVQSYVYPHTGEMYGQDMFCLTMNVKNMDTAFKQFPYTNPQVYGSQWVSSLASQMPNANAFMNQGLVYNTTTSHVVNIQTVGGFKVKHFAKTAIWGQSIYGNLIGPYYSANMLVETWQDPYQPPLLPPTSQESVYSVLNLQAPSYAEWDGVTWANDNEHAKWGMTINGTSNVFCIGDINKQQSQWQRSGGMACMTDAVLYNAFTEMITQTDIDGATPNTLKKTQVKMQ